MRKYKGSARAEAINVFITRHKSEAVSDGVNGNVIETLSNTNLTFAILAKNFSPSCLTT